MNIIYFQIKYLFRLLIENKPFKKLHFKNKYQINYIKNEYCVSNILKDIDIINQ